MSIRKCDRSSCPQCGSARVVPIMYGLPDEKGRDAASRGEVHLGGCCITGDDPDRHCHACGHEWRLGGGEAYPDDADSLERHVDGTYGALQMKPEAAQDNRICCTGLFFAQIVERSVILECCTCGRLWRCSPDGTLQPLDAASDADHESRPRP